MQAAARIAFLAALTATFVMAVIPHPPPLPGSPGDKIQHILAFATLSVLGTLAYPRLSFIRLFAGLILFGALIEVVQAIPALHRNSDILDLLADGVGALVAGLALRTVLRLRSH